MKPPAMKQETMDSIAIIMVKSITSQLDHEKSFNIGRYLYRRYRDIRKKYPEPITAEEILMLEKLEE